jgi:hypothetical protein
MTKSEMQVWHDEQMRGLAETEAKMCSYLHSLEDSQGAFENIEMLLAMKAFELAMHNVALYVARVYCAFNAMGEPAGTA